MTQRTHVPKFGNWENDGTVPYTQYFENARKGRSGERLINPNDPQDNPEAFGSEARKPTDELHTSSNGSTSHHDSSAARKRTVDSPHHRHGDRKTSGDYQRRAGRVSGGSDYRARNSPLHPSYQMKAGAYYSSESLSRGSHARTSNSAGRLRMAGDQYDKTVKKGSAVPKFGEWDESDPSSADGFTDLFNKVKEDKQTGSAKVPNVSSDKTYVNEHGSTRESSGCWCFSWCK